MKSKSVKNTLILFALLLLAGCHSASIESQEPMAEKKPIPNTTPTANPVATPFTADQPSASQIEMPDAMHNKDKLKLVSCTDKELVGIWQELIKDIDLNDYISDSDADEDCAAFIAIAKKIDLNNDKNSDFFVEGIGSFSAASTKPIWVMERKNGIYKVLLKEQGELYYVKKTKTNGFNDLYFPSRRNVWSSTLSTYKYGDGEYRISTCQVGFYYKSQKPIKVFSCDNTEGIKKFESEFVYPKT